MERGQKTKELWKNPAYRQHMSEAHKGKRPTEETRRKLSLAHKGVATWNKGLKTGSLAEETKNKIRMANTGKRHSEETKTKMSLAKMGKPLSVEHRTKISLSNIGRPSGMLGKKLSEETKRKIGLKSKGNKYSLGHRHTEDTKKRISEANKGHIPYIMTDEIRKTMRESNLANSKRVFKNTSIELALESELQKRNIQYQKQVPLCKVAIVDFYLSQIKAIIQADGCYWHGCPEHFPNLIERRNKGIVQDLALTANGFTVYRFWEHEIKKSAEDCINKVSVL